MRNFFYIAFLTGTVCFAEEPREFEGVIEYGKTTVVSFEAKGRIAYVASPGQYVQCSVFDAAGNIVRDGELLAKQDTSLPESDVRIAELQLRRARTVLAEREANFRRDKLLTDRDAVSRRTFQDSEMQYETALIDTQKAEAQLERSREVLDACYIRAPYNAVVDEVFRSEGASVDVAHPVLQICMIDPVRLRITLSPEMREKLRGATQILVYPEDAKEPVHAWFSGQNLSADTLICFAANPLVRESVKGPDGKPVPCFDDLSTVLRLPSKQTVAPLWVNTAALKFSPDGDAFVWRLSDVADTGSLDLIPCYSRLEKVPVHVLNFFIRYGNSMWRGIQGISGLKANDVLACDVPEDYVTGSLAAYHRKRHLFRIGEKVRVTFLTPCGDSKNSVQCPK